MIDLKWVREHKKEFDCQLKKRGLDPVSNEIVMLDQEKRQNITLLQQLHAARNSKSKILGPIKDKNSKQFEDLRKDIEHINQKLSELESRLSQQTKLEHLLDRAPNVLSEEVPEGFSEEENKLIRDWGNPKIGVNFREHFEIGEKLKMLDFEQTVKISGSRFVTLIGPIARLARALANFMLDIHTKEFNFTEISPPYMVRETAMYNVGLLPKFHEDSFEVVGGYRLIPTGEVSLVNFVADTILKKKMLPVRFVTETPCFRSEAGSSGKDNHGMIRLHQFNKVELVSVTTPDLSSEEHEYLLNAAEVVLQRLGLPYRVVMLCAGETGFTSSKTYDLEVWLPGQKKYREIGSCSNCTDFQARRMKARYKENILGKEEIRLVHTLNSSGLPIGRTIVAIIENYQNADGSFDVPENLVSYMDGVKRIG